jgi:hypothetical protein
VDQRLVRSAYWCFLVLLAALVILMISVWAQTSGSRISLAYFKKLIVGHDLSDQPIKDGDGANIKGSNIQQVVLDETTASLIADPTSDGNRHEIAAAGADTFVSGSGIFGCAEDGDSHRYNSIVQRMRAELARVDAV